jgi:plastocyanin
MTVTDLDTPTGARWQRLLPRRALFLAVVGGLAGGGLLARSVLAAAPPSPTVTIDNFTFTPGALTVPVGTTVTWRNRDDIPHSIVGKDGAFRSAALDTDDRYSFTFKTAGTFDYVCGLHPHMTGKVIVTP